MVLEEGLFVKNGSADEISEPRCGEEHPPIGLSIGFGVLHSDGAKTLADGLGGLINSKNSFAR